LAAFSGICRRSIPIMAGSPGYGKVRGDREVRQVVHVTAELLGGLSWDLKMYWPRMG